MEFLKDVLGELWSEEIQGKFNAEFPKHAVPKDQYNKKVEEVSNKESELKNANDKLEELNGTVSKLKDEVGVTEELKQKFEKVNSDFETYKKETDDRIVTIKKRSAYEKMLVQSGVNESALDLLVQTADYEKINLTEDGDIQKKDEIINELKEKRKSLFNEHKVDSKVKDNDGKSDDGKGLEDMTTEEYYESIGMKPFNRR